MNEDGAKESLPFCVQLLAIDGFLGEGQSLSSVVYPVDETIRLPWTVSNPRSHRPSY